MTRQKAALRHEVRIRLKDLSAEKRATDSGQACSRLERQGVWKAATAILFYAPLPQEPDIWRLVGDSLTAGKIVALPRYDAGAGKYVACRIRGLDDVSHGHLRIREPGAHCVHLDLNRLDLVLVPGVAFDLHGRRLGRGKGFYDRLLALVRGTTCGVAFDEQIVAEIPVEPHDVHVNCILTPTRWIKP